MFPLTRIDSLAAFIIGISLEGVVLNSLILEFEEHVARRFREGKSVDEITREVHEILSRRGQKVTNVNTDYTNVYNESSQAMFNVETWKAAETIASAKRNLGEVRVQLTSCPKLIIFSFHE